MGKGILRWALTVIAFVAAASFVEPPHTDFKSYGVNADPVAAGIQKLANIPGNALSIPFDSMSKILQAATGTDISSYDFEDGTIDIDSGMTADERVLLAAHGVFQLAFPAIVAVWAFRGMEDLEEGVDDDVKTRY
ncbi:MAG: hypothetical protein FWF71_05725 [Actinomycetia bacterium]|nr:hypothetical protein [Actinomycetes bacterium]